MRLPIVLSAALFCSISAFADAGSENVVKCSDQKGRVLIIDRVTGLTGGIAGTYLASVSVNGKAIGFPQTVTKSHLDVTYPATFSGGGIEATVGGPQFTDIPVTQSRGTLKLSGDKKPASMLCNKGPAFDK